MTQRPSGNRRWHDRGYESKIDGNFRISNPNLRPQKTTEYEAGFRQRLGENARYSGQWLLPPD